MHRVNKIEPDEPGGDDSISHKDFQVPCYIIIKHPLTPSNHHGGLLVLYNRRGFDPVSLSHWTLDFLSPNNDNIVLCILVSLPHILLFTLCCIAIRYVHSRVLSHTHTHTHTQRLLPPRALPRAHYFRATLWTTLISSHPALRGNTRSSRPRVVSLKATRRDMLNHLRTTWDRPQWLIVTRQLVFVVGKIHSLQIRFVSLDFLLISSSTSTFL